MSDASAPRACVYTCLVGGYEALNEQPAAARSGLDFICFTDDASLTSATWRMVPYAGAFPLDPVRSQRMAKFSPHEMLPGYDVSLYIDNSVILKVPPEEVIARYLPGPAKLAMPGHSFRASVRDEFMEVLRSGLDDGGRVLEQLNHYQLTDPAGLDAVPLWSAIILRRHHDPEVVAAMRLWLAQVLRYSRRDQLSSAHALRRAGLEVARFEIDNLGSWFHDWPVTDKRDRAAFPFSPVLSQLPPPVLAEEWRRTRIGLEERIGTLEQALAAARAEADALRGELGAALAAGAGSADAGAFEAEPTPDLPIPAPNEPRTASTSTASTSVASTSSPAQQPEGRPAGRLSRLASALALRRRP